MSRKRERQPMRIFTSTLTNPPRYYASDTYRSRIDTVNGVELVEITGRKWDVTEEIEAIRAFTKKAAKVQKETTHGH